MIETGILFDDIHSFRDLNLVLAPFVLVPAKPKTNFIDIPGGDGSIDATEATGEVKYNDREFAFTFTVFPGDDLTFEERQTVVSNALNGKRCKITIEKDPDYYLEGRCTVNEYFANKNLRQIVVNVRCAPYKMKQHETFMSFDLASTEERTIVLPNGKKRVVPTIEANCSFSISFNGYSKEYPLGMHASAPFKDLNIRLAEGTNIMTLKSTNYPGGTIKFSYREGDL